MGEPQWLRLGELLQLHDELVALTGGVPGLRDQGLLESALARPENRFAYEGVDDICELAATYAVAVAKNHPFADGNKRAAFMAMTLFLEINGRTLTANEDDATGVMLEVAGSTLGVEELSEWVKSNSR